MKNWKGVEYNMIQNFDFTIAVSPNSMLSIDKEIKYIKTALLYADKITLISPAAHILHEFTGNQKYGNIDYGLSLFYKVLPLIKLADFQVYLEADEAISEFKNIYYSKKYKNAPAYMRLEVREMFDQFSKGISESLREAIGNDICRELFYLVENNIVKVDTFKTAFDDLDNYVMEYFIKLESSTKCSYSLFDEVSNNLMSAALKDGVVDISNLGKDRIRHASLVDKLLIKLPSFEFAKVDEILDIRKELEKPLMRFRSKTIEYTESIQTLPWDKDFEDECFILYNKEIVPSILEIDEMVKDNNIFKNLGIKVLTDQSMLTGLGGLVLSVAGAGAITSFSNAMASNKAMLVTGGAWAVSKIASTYNDYKAKEKEVERKDLYFYYKAGRNIIDEKYRM